MKLADMYECAVPVGHLTILIPRVVERTGEQPTSVYRGKGSEHILNKYGKHSQPQLYHATPAERVAWHILGTPDRPGTSTHECRSDGVAFPGPVGRRILRGKCGQDWRDAAIGKVMFAYRQEGQTPIHPYPPGVTEYHHINLAHIDPISLSFLPLLYQDRGRMVRVLANRLVVCGHLQHSSDKFGLAMRGAVDDYQNHHHLPVTGLVDEQTWISLRATARFHRRHPHHGHAHATAH